MDEAAGFFRKTRNVSALEANSMYQQIKIYKRKKSKKMRTEHHRDSQLLQVPFSLKNEPATFKQLLEVVLSSLETHSALAYLKDLLFCSDSINNYEVYFWQELTELKDAGGT